MKKENRKEILYIIISVFIFAYLLNFLWESYHSIYLYTCCKEMNSVSHIKLITYVSFIDSLIILGIYLAISVFWRDYSWIYKIKKEQIYTFIILGLIVALIIEYKAVYLFHQWSYSDLMPTIFGIGLSPLIQLSITGIIDILLTRRLLYK